MPRSTRTSSCYDRADRDFNARADKAAITARGALVMQCATLWADGRKPSRRALREVEPQLAALSWIELPSREARMAAIILDALAIKGIGEMRLVEVCRAIGARRGVSDVALDRFVRRQTGRDREGQMHKGFDAALREAGWPG